MRAAQKFDAKCVGVTLSENQYALAKKRIAKAGLMDQIEIRLQDYRNVTGKFDRITSVDMFKHVGLKKLPMYFSRIQLMLKDDGRRGGWRSWMSKICVDIMQKLAAYGPII